MPKCCPAILTLMLIAVLWADPVGSAAGDETRTVKVGGATRGYRVHLPRSYDSARPHPVVLIFHGGGSDADTMVDFSGLNHKADAAGFIAVYPTGSGRLRSTLTWNAGNCCGYALEHRVDDIAFTRRLLDDLSSTYRVDRRRVFATGMSNGAMLAHRLGAELSDTIAAIAPVAGPLGLESIRPARPVPVMHFHGTADDHAPYEGGNGRRSRTPTNFYSVAYTISQWVSANGCSPTPTIVDEPNRADDEMTVKRSSYSRCRDDAEVVLFTIERGGHTWPGTQPARRAVMLMLGPTTRDISANDLMWDFFSRHPLTTGSAQTAGTGLPAPRASARSTVPYQGPKVTLDLRPVAGGTEATVTTTFRTGGWDQRQDRTRVENGVGLVYLTFVGPGKNDMVTQRLESKRWSWRSETPFSRAEIWVNIIRRDEPPRDTDYRLALRHP